MKRMLISLAVAVSTVAAGVGIASAANFSGRLFLVQTTGTEGTLRFFVNTPTPLSLFASGDAKLILLQALALKANVDVGYTPIVCPGGISPPCGVVVSVSLNATAF